MTDSIVNPNWMTTKEAAEYLGVRESTLRYWAKNGKLRSAHLTGKAVVYWRDDVEALKRERESEGK